jgi:very-short-patch-repair endonuclease
VLDFFCAAAALAIEVDGPVHDQERRAASDFFRDQYLIKRGARTLRVSTDEVLGDLDGVLARIRGWIEQPSEPADDHLRTSYPVLGPPLAASRPVSAQRAESAIS